MSSFFAHPSQIPLWFDFLYSTALALILPYIIPGLPSLFWFAPFLAKVYSQRAPYYGLIWALVSGMIMELWTTELKFGMQMLHCTVTQFLLSCCPCHFWEHRAIVRPFLAACWSVVGFFVYWECMQTTLAPPSFQLLWQGLSIIPFYHGVYSFVCFVLPPLLLHKIYPQYGAQPGARRYAR